MRQTLSLCGGANFFYGQTVSWRYFRLAVDFAQIQHNSVPDAAFLVMLLAIFSVLFMQQQQQRAEFANVTFFLSYLLLSFSRSVQFALQINEKLARSVTPSPAPTQTPAQKVVEVKTECPYYEKPKCNAKFLRYEPRYSI